MSHTFTDSPATAFSNITVPDDGDPQAALSVNVALEALANRTKRLQLLQPRPFADFTIVTPLLTVYNVDSTLAEINIGAGVLPSWFYGGVEIDVMMMGVVDYSAALNQSTLGLSLKFQVNSGGMGSAVDAGPFVDFDAPNGGRRVATVIYSASLPGGFDLGTAMLQGKKTLNNSAQININSVQLTALIIPKDY